MCVCFLNTWKIAKARRTTTEQHVPIVRPRFHVSETFETCLIYYLEIFHSSAYAKNRLFLRRTWEYFASWKNSVLYDPLNLSGTNNARVRKNGRNAPERGEHTL